MGNIGPWTGLEKHGSLDQEKYKAHMDQITIKTPNPKCRFYWFNRVYRLEIQSVMLVFSTPLVNLCPSNLLTGSPTPLSPFPV
jgi:hypothetical protein